MPGKAIERTRVERVARLYASNDDAAQALGINPRSFARLCRRYRIQTPHARRQQRRVRGRAHHPAAAANGAPSAARSVTA